MATSSVDELMNLFPNWSINGLTWQDFGGCTQNDLDGLKAMWFPDNIENRIKVQGIWNRHPLRQQGMYL
jgi:hypothetical protein